MQWISCARFFRKRFFPVFWFGEIGLLVALGILAPTPVPAPLLFLLPPVLTVTGYAAWPTGRRGVGRRRPAAARKDGREERIPCANIINVNAVLFANPPRVTLRRASPGIFGREVAFSPDARR